MGNCPEEDEAQESYTLFVSLIRCLKVVDSNMVLTLEGGAQKRNIILILCLLYLGAASLLHLNRFK